MRDEFMIERQGKQYVLFAGLLEEAHAKGLLGIKTELKQVPNADNDNVAIVKAKALFDHDKIDALGAKVFEGIGDASPKNVGRNIVPHIIRMAETRAKARALRDAINVGVTALEELGGGDEEEAPPRQVRTSRAPTSGKAQQAQNPASAQTGKPRQAGRLKEVPNTHANAGDKHLTKSQAARIKHYVEKTGQDFVEWQEMYANGNIFDLTEGRAQEWIDYLEQELANQSEGAE